MIKTVGRPLNGLGLESEAAFVASEADLAARQTAVDIRRAANAALARATRALNVASRRTPPDEAEITSAKAVKAAANTAANTAARAHRAVLAHAGRVSRARLAAKVAAQAHGVTEITETEITETAETTIDHHSVSQAYSWLLLHPEHAPGEAERYQAWLSNVYLRMARWNERLANGQWPDLSTNTRRFFRAALGRQLLCVQFRHRNWVWADLDAGWVLYVDKRGPALHITSTACASPAGAREAVRAFTDRVDAFLIKTALETMP